MLFQEGERGSIPALMCRQGRDMENIMQYSGELLMRYEFELLTAFYLGTILAVYLLGYTRGMLSLMDRRRRK